MRQMQQYKELDEAVRMMLSRSEVEEYIQRELMARGIKPEENPGELQIKAPSLKKQVVYRVNLGSSYEYIDFKTWELAKRFMDCKPLKVRNDYHIGESFSWAQEIKEPTVEQIEVYIKDEVLAKSEELIEYKEAQGRWHNQKEAWQYYCKRRAEVESEILGDWNKLQVKAEQQQKIRASFNEYLELANQDTTIARNFLIKTYGEQQVIEAIPILATEETAQDAQAEAEMERAVDEATA